MGIWQLTAIAVVTVLTAVLVFRMHAFLALLLAAGLVATLTPTEQLFAFSTAQKASTKAATEFAQSHPLERVAKAFGQTTGSVGIMIGLASIIGGCLLESGAAKAIVQHSLQWVSPKRAPEALAASSFVIGIPVYFDTVFYLMSPLARQLRRDLGKDYCLFILAIMAGGSIAHSLVPPTPGPLQVAATLKVSIAAMMLGGCSVGLASSFLSLLAARVINRWVDIPLRGESELDQVEPPQNELEDLSEEKSPPIFLSLFPILLPIFLIAQSTCVSVWNPDTSQAFALRLLRFSEFLGDKNFALALATVAALYLLRWAPAKTNRQNVINQALASGGVIILITSAGGAFGEMLRQAGVAEALGQIAATAPKLALLPFAFLVTAAIRTVQGSATVAMITSAGVLQGLATVDQLGCHPVYLALAIGAGSKPIAWMTDSGFWVICKMSNMTETEGLKTISPLTCAMGCSALLVTMIAAWLFPFNT